MLVGTFATKRAKKAIIPVKMPPTIPIIIPGTDSGNNNIRRISPGITRRHFISFSRKFFAFSLYFFKASPLAIIISQNNNTINMSNPCVTNSNCKTRKVISISLSPNTEKDDLWLTLRVIFNPFYWKKGKTNYQLESKFKDYLKLKHSFLFNSGRSSFLAILDAFGVKKGDEVLLQGFTCSSAVVPILTRGARPVFVDIDKTLNLDPEELRKKITLRSKVVVIQHTFGYPAKIDEIMQIAKEKKLFVIEDCAHSLGTSYKGKLCGTFGDASFFSFGRDKVISSVFGGMAVTNNDILAARINQIREKLDYPSRLWIFQQLIHPILVRYLILPFYRIPFLGKILLGGLQKIKILSKAVYKDEKKEGIMSPYFPKRMPNAFSILGLNQFNKLKRFNSHRKEIAHFYKENLKETSFSFITENDEGSIFMRFPVFVDNSNEIIKRARKERILLNDGWRKSSIVPPDTNTEKMKYSKGTCLEAEKVADKILNLPTHINISKKEAKKIIKFLKDYDNQRNN
jgi:perosamine synthetase